jgi:hypothetical protein
MLAEEQMSQVENLALLNEIINVEELEQKLAPSEVASVLE